MSTVCFQPGGSCTVCPHCKCRVFKPLIADCFDPGKTEQGFDPFKKKDVHVVRGDEVEEASIS